MKKIFLTLLCLAFLLSFLAGCDFMGMGDGADDTAESAAGSTVDSESVTEEETVPQQLTLSVDGTNISQYRIVYNSAAFTREQCFEDLKAVGEALSAEIEDLTGIKLPVVSDMEKATAKEIILGVAIRAECTRYYNEDTKLNIDEYCAVNVNGKILLGADCAAGVIDACEAFTGYIRAALAEGKTSLDIAADFDVSGKKHVQRIVCVGDSITQGCFVEDESKESYPAILQRELGNEYDVVNLGKGGTTMSSYSCERYTTKSYIDKSGYYDTLLAIAPYTDLVVIMLGSNDAAGGEDTSDLFQNNYDTFKMDYTVNLTKMVTDLRAANAGIKIMVFSTTKTVSVRESNLVTYVRPLQKELATKLKLDFYDMYSFSNVNMSINSDYSDTLHPTATGYQKMGIEAAKILKERYNFT